MDDLLIAQILAGTRDREERQLKELGYWLAWTVSHIYNQNPYIKSKVKISDLIILDKQSGEDQKEANERKVKKTEELLKKWDEFDKKKKSG